MQATARWGRYRKVLREEAEPDDGPMWRREPMEGHVAIDLVPGPIADRTPVPSDPGVKIRGLVRRRRDDFIVSLFLVNNQSEPERNEDSAFAAGPLDLKLSRNELYVAITRGARSLKVMPGSRRIRCRS